jgi:hypothetical protein
MTLNGVTFTGADDSVSPDDLLAISREHPFVEWGILFSQKRQGSPRYPSDAWTRRLAAANAHGDLKLAAHLCGQWVRDLVVDVNFSWKRTTYSWLWSDIARFQLNFHGQFHRQHAEFHEAIAHHADVFGRAFILQCDGPNDTAVKAILDGDTICPLFDRSGGAGVEPDQWPAAIPGVYCGYAGGLGPDTISQQLDTIAQAAGDATIWIDMETRVRSDDDRTFDLEKVRRVLEQVATR